MPVCKASSTDGQVLHDAAPAGLGERTMRAGSPTALWDAHQISDRAAASGSSTTR